MHTQLHSQRAEKKKQHPEHLNTENGIWNMLQSAGMVQMAEMISAIHDIAPKPGSLVLIDVRMLPMKWDDWQPVLFSAADVCTHMQIARMYITPTLASAIEFLQFISGRYPFPMKEVRTSADSVFVNPGSLQSKHQFTTEAKRLGMFHSVVLDTAEDQTALRLISRHNYVESFEGSFTESSKDKVLNGLVNFLFFHNNHRALASLGGLTPLQKLNSFAGYEHIPWFDPYLPLETRKAGNA
jgi:hypothetical protein